MSLLSVIKQDLAVNQIITMKLKNKFIYTISLLVILLFISETFLRTYLGFCHAVLVREDPNYEYISAANQHVYRFRKNVFYNEQSMRSPSIDSNSIHILGFGDSLINGGVLTDQDSLATTKLTTALSEIYGKKVQFLNISAGSWGPDNCYAYLEQHGAFAAEKIYLFVSSHDAHDNMRFEKVVGISKDHQDKQYKIALFELLDRYVIPILKGKLLKPSQDIDKQPLSKEFNPGFEKFAAYSKIHHIPLVIYLHAEITEMQAGKYNQQGQGIIQFAKDNHIDLLMDIEQVKENDYSDQIHLNEHGQGTITAAVLKEYARVNDPRFAIIRH
ncbi:hypothetical protein [Pedobacter sp.]|uniref:hypothetical protein n=1 Tax=Pedobacter sp. TaxID=1411316 RepID=UPI003D7FFA2D